MMCDGLFLYPGENLHDIRTPQDLERIQPIGRDHPWIRAHVRHVARVTAIDPDRCYFYNVFSPSMLLRIFIDEPAYLTLFREAPEQLAAALGRMGEGLAALADAVIREGGADGLFYCVQNTRLDVIGDANYKKHISPSDKQVLQAANTASQAGNILHICGYEGRRNNLEAWADYEAKAFNWATHVEQVPLEEGRRIFGGRAVVGGFDNTAKGLLNMGGRQEIENATQALVERTGSTGVIVAADCSLPFDIAVEHLVWVRQKLEAMAR